jgi:hypothetical protein
LGNSDSVWPAYGGNVGLGGSSGGSSTSSTISTYPSYLGCNVTSPTATYNPPALTYTELGSGGSGGGSAGAPGAGGGAGAASAAQNASSLPALHSSSITHGQMAPTATGNNIFPDFFSFSFYSDEFQQKKKHCPKNEIQFRSTAAASFAFSRSTRAQIQLASKSLKEIIPTLQIEFHLAPTCAPLTSSRLVQNWVVC